VQIEAGLTRDIGVVSDRRHGLALHLRYRRGVTGTLQHSRRLAKKPWVVKELQAATRPPLAVRPYGPPGTAAQESRPHALGRLNPSGRQPGLHFLDFMALGGNDLLGQL